MGTVLTPILSATANTSRAYNPGMAETYSWVPIEGDALGRPLYARAGYITNFSDMSIYLSASELSIGAVTIKDNNSGLNADVVNIPDYGAGLQVLTQDLESNIDDITIGDKNSNYADVVPHLSALKVNVTNLNDSANLDAFGRLRTSYPFTIFDSKSIYGGDRFFWNIRGVDGTNGFNENDASLNLSVSAVNGYIAKETYMRFAYQPGKSQLVIFSAVLKPEAGLTKRIGTFTSLSGNNYTQDMVGIYFEAANNTVAWVIKQPDGTVVPSQSATQANWNIDKMDGTGPSGLTLDWSKAQIFTYDYEWLGTGRVRFGFNVNGITYYCHQINNANNNTGTYLRMPNLPMRAELRSVGASSGVMKFICCSIMSEGGAEPSFVTRSVSTSATITPGSNTRKGILGVRLKRTRSNAHTQIIDISTIPIVTNASSLAPYRYEVVLRPTPVTGVTWNSIDPNSNIEYAQPGVGGVDIIGGISMIKGFASSNTIVNIESPQYDKVSILGTSLDQIQDEVWLVITPYDNAFGYHGSITVAEAE